MTKPHSITPVPQDLDPVDRVDVDDHVIRIIGDNTDLEHAIISGFSAATTDARGFVRKWRAHGESNPGLIRERDLS